MPLAISYGDWNMVEHGDSSKANPMFELVNRLSKAEKHLLVFFFILPVG
jgi:hypothetical protein